MHLRPFGVTRFIFFGLIILCSLGVLAFEISLNSLINNLVASQLNGVHVYNTQTNWSVGHWAIGASIVTIGALIVLLTIDLIRMWSLVVIELATMAGLGVVWIIAAFKVTSGSTATQCEKEAAHISTILPPVNTICHRHEVLSAVCGGPFGLIMAYSLFLVFLAIRARKQGHRFVWFRSGSNLAFILEHTNEDKVRSTPTNTERTVSKENHYRYHPVATDL